MAIKYDIVATVGTYENEMGETKYINRKIGAFIETEKGPKIKLDAYFNLAGCPRTKDGSIWAACFEPRQKNNDTHQNTEVHSDDIPF